MGFFPHPSYGVYFSMSKKNDGELLCYLGKIRKLRQNNGTYGHCTIDLWHKVVEESGLKWYILVYRGIKWVKNPGRKHVVHWTGKYIY